MEGRPNPDSKAFDDPGAIVEIPRVNRIRSRVKDRLEAGYPGICVVTRRLLEELTDPEEYDISRSFFCRAEAAETLIWLTEEDLSTSAVFSPGTPNGTTVEWKPWRTSTLENWEQFGCVDAIESLLVVQDIEYWPHSPYAFCQICGIVTGLPLATAELNIGHS